MYDGIPDSVAIVTGAASGIGRATAVRFAEEGARVLVADVDEDGIAETVSLVEAASGEAVGVTADVREEADVAAMVETAVDEFGGLDYLVNNAGIEGDMQRLLDTSAEAWERVQDVNLRGAFFGIKHAVPRMLDGDGGAVVNVASVAGLVGFENAGAYTASKHGLVGLTKSAALEFADDGVRVNAVCPGIVDTPMIDRATGGDEAAREGFVGMEPVGRMADPAEIAGTIVWACSADASYVTGHALAVDGGLVAR